jgi:hypothetical protein
LLSSSSRSCYQFPHTYRSFVVVECAEAAAAAVVVVVVIVDAISFGAQV